MDIEQLRYPIGKYNPGDVKLEHISPWIEEIATLPQRLSEMVEPLSHEQLAFTYRPDGWNIQQLVHHLADSHMNAIIRFKLALTEDHPTIKPYSEADWTVMHDVIHVPISASLGILRGVHERLTSLLKHLNVSDFSRTYAHPEYGKIFDVAFTIGMYAWHGNHHLAHIQLALDHGRAEWE